MNQPIVQCLGGITLVGGGPVFARDLALALRLAPVAIGADSGADRLLAAGVLPEAVIGDFDSISQQARASLPPQRQHHIADQDSTDFDKALRHIRGDFVLALGFSGARSDHGLAVLNSLVRHSDRPCLVIGAKDITFALPAGVTEISMRPGDPFSLFPFARVTGRSTGLEWPLDGHVFAPDGFIATSNRVTTGRLRLEMDANGMVAILPKSRLKQAIAAVTGR